MTDFRLYTFLVPIATLNAVLISVNVCQSI